MTDHAARKASWESTLTIYEEDVSTANATRWVLPMIEIVHRLQVLKCDENFYASQSHGRFVLSKIAPSVFLRPHLMVEVLAAGGFRSQSWSVDEVGRAFVLEDEETHHSVDDVIAATLRLLVTFR